MTRDEVFAIIKERKAAKWWQIWFKPWAIQEDLLLLAKYIEETDNPFDFTASPAEVALQKLADERLKALNAVQAWIMATFGPSAEKGPPRDLLKDVVMLTKTK